MCRSLSRHFSIAVLIYFATYLGHSAMYAPTPFAPAPLDALFSTTDIPTEIRQLSTTAAQASTTPQIATRELVIFDDAVENWLQLANDVEQQRAGGRAIDYIVLERDRDGVTQISEALRSRTDLSAVHLVAHGAAGTVQVGDTTLQLSNIAEYTSQLIGWRDAFAAGGDLLIYGCNVANNEDGQVLLESLALLTETDLAASENLTGNAKLGGDWKLERQVGELDSQLPFTAAVRKDWANALDININQAWLNAHGAGPYYLDQANTTYRLQTNVTTAGSAFAIIAPDVVFDLNGFTITYDNAMPISVINGSFEQGTGAAATGWDFSAAPNAQRHQGVWLHNEVYDGSYSLKFAVPAANQQVTSTSTVILQPNTTYSLSAMFEYGGLGNATNPGVKAYVRLTGTGLPTHETSWNASNWRGIQLRECTFSTGATAESYTIQVGIEGAATVGATNVYIDDIKIQRTRVHGVFAGPTSWATATHNDLSRFGAATRAVITNGRIRQGSGNSTWSPGVMAHDANNITMNSLDVTVQGANSSALFGYQQGPYSSTISNNSLTSNVLTISSRDAYDGTVVKGFKGVISGNTIHNGPLTGIWTLGTGASQVFNNTIRLKSRYTNAFAIVGEYGSDIYNNLIDCGSGEYGARGIRAAGATSDVALVYNNIVRSQILANNQEYEGVPLGGAYCIQLEGVGNIEVYQNQFFAYANGVEAHAFRANSITSPVYVHHNELHAVSVGTADASLIKLLTIDATDIVFEDNQLFTNYGIVGGTLHATFSAVRSTLAISSPLAVADPVVLASGYDSGASLNAEITFVDTVFADAAARAYLENALPRQPANYGGLPENRMAFASGWTTTLVVRGANAQPLPNASVSIRSADGSVQLSGTTDANGEFRFAANQFRTQGATRTDFNDYTIGITSGGQTDSQVITIDRPQTIQLSLGTGGTVNQAPVLDNSGAMAFSPLTEDQLASGGQSVAAILASAGGIRITDPDAGALVGIAITNQASGNGSWQFSTNAGTNWTAVGSVSASSALLLRDSDLLRFVPNGQNGTSASVTFRAWDQTSGSAGSKVDTSANGGTSAFSTATETATLTVNSVNDAPLLDNSGTMSLNPINEDQTNHAGQTVASVIASAGGDRITDVDSGAVEGIAITAVQNGNGWWQFSTDSGATWQNVGTVSNTSASVAASQRTGPLPTQRTRTAPPLRSTSAPGTKRLARPATKVDTSTSGGNTAFSAATESASITVTSVNDAPVLDINGSMFLDDIADDDTNNPGNSVAQIIASAGGDRITDVDAIAYEGMAIVNLQTGNGVWQFSTDGGTTWQNVGAVSNSSALLLRAADWLRYVPAGNPAADPFVDFRAWDQTNGGQGTKVNTSTNGGTTAFSTAVEVASISVSASGASPYLIQQQGSTLVAYGNQWNNYFSWSAYVPNEFYIDGYRHTVPTGVNSIQFIGGDGSDTFQVNGTPGVDTLLASVGAADFTSLGWLIKSQSAETLIVFGDGGADSRYAERLDRRRPVFHLPGPGRSERTWLQLSLASVCQRDCPEWRSNWRRSFSVRQQRERRLHRQSRFCPVRSERRRATTGARLPHHPRVQLCRPRHREAVRFGRR